MNKDESLYIAGPNCFWPRGGNSLQAYREYSLFHGFKVALPGDPKPAEEKKDQKPWDEMTKKERGANILKNCEVSMDNSTAIIANLDNYRGYSPDGGTVFEIGMAYAKEAKCYAYTRDIRPTGDFLNKLLSFRNGIEVLEPADVRQKMKDIITETLRLYDM